MSQVATPELRQWIVEQARAGCKPEAVLSAMTQAGWREDVAIAAMEATLGEHLAALPRTTAPEPPAEPKRLPEPQMTGHPRQVDAGDVTASVLRQRGARLRTVVDHDQVGSCVHLLPRMGRTLRQLAGRGKRQATLKA